ncbi:MAG: phage baseplate protein [Thomasclavelia ramosa]
MIFSTITQKGLELTYDLEKIPSQYSGDIEMKLIRDTTYNNYVCTPFFKHIKNRFLESNRNTKSNAIAIDSNGVFKLPKEAFRLDGYIAIAFSFARDSEVIQTNPIVYKITASVGDGEFLDNKPSWQQIVIQLCEDWTTENIKPELDKMKKDIQNAIGEAMRQQEKITSQQTQIDNAIGNMGDYEIVQEDPVQIRFKKGDGTFGEIVDLGDGLASKAMVNAGYYTYKGISYGGSASNNGIDVAEIDGAYSQETTNGFQLFDASKLPTKSQGGATVTNNGDGSFTISGNGALSGDFSQFYQYTHEETLKMLKVGKITLNQNGDDTTPYALARLVKTGGVGIWFQLTKAVQSANITQEMLQDVGCALQIFLYGSSGSAIQKGTIKPMLYQDGDGTFEPFTGGIASPNPEYPQEPKFVGDYNEGTQKYDIDFMTSGKNLFNINGNVNVDGYSKEQKTTNTVENGVLTCNVNSARDHGVGQRLYGLKGKTISVSAKLKSLGEATIGNIYIYESSGAYKAVSNATALDTVFAINNYTCKTDDIVVAFAGTGGTGVQFYDIMVNYGAKFVDYEPFTGFETTTVELNQPLRELPNGVKDTVENGIVTRRVGEIIFDGSEMWYKNSGSNSNNWMYYVTIAHIRAKGLCDSLLHKEIADINSDGARINRVGFNFNHNATVMYLNVGYYMQQAGLTNTVENLKTWLQSNPITVWYELATPTTEQITLPTLPSWYPYTNAWVGTELQPSFVEWHIKIAGVNQNDLTVIKEDISQLQTETTQLNDDVTMLMGAFTSVTDLTKQLFLLMHRVGDIIFSTSDENPSTIYGGTWVAWGKGKVPVGVDTSDSDFNTVEKTGGEKEHTLTVDEMPSHKHDFGQQFATTSNLSGAYGYYMIAGTQTDVIKNTGGNQPHNNLQPYITCYMWKRTA